MADKDFIVKNGLVTGTNTVTVGNTVYIVANGNVGFGNSSPAHKLSVYGNVYSNAVNTTDLSVSGIFNISSIDTNSYTIGNYFTANTLGLYHLGTVNAASHTVGISTIANSTGVYATTVNASSHTTGNVTTGAGGVLANLNTIFVGNNTVNAYLNTVGLNINAVTIANTTGVYTGTVNAASHTVGTSTIANSTGVYTGVVNGSSITVGTSTIANTTGVYTGTVNAASHTVGTSTIANSTGVYTGTVNAASHTVGTSTIANATGVYTGVVNGSSITVGTVFVANSSKLTFTGSNIDATSAFLKVADAVISGNLVVSGSVVSVNTSTLMVNDNIIELGDNNVTTDVVDTGFYSPAGNSSSIWYSGIVRQAAKSTNSNPYFWLFGSNTNPNTSSVVDISSNSSTATLQSYLVPYGIGGAFVANSTVVNITANSSLSSTLSVNNVFVNATVNAAVLSVGTSTIANSTGVYATTVNASSHTTGNVTTGTGGLVANVTTVFIGNNTVNAYLNTTQLNINAVTIANTTGVYTGVVNGSSITVGTSTIANTTGVYTGVVNGSSITVGTSTIANTTGVYTGIVNGSSITVGTSTIANTTGVYTGAVNASSYTTGNTTTGTGGLIANVTTVFIGNNTVNVYLNTIGLNINAVTIANTSGVYTGTVNATTVNAASHTVGTSTIANSTGVYTGVVNGSSITVGTSTIANSTGVYTGVVNGSSITVGTSTIANSTGVYTGLVNAISLTASKIVSNASGLFVTSGGLFSDVNINATSYTTGNTTTGTGGLLANVTTVFIGNNTVNSYLNSTALNVGAYSIINTTALYLANGTITTANFSACSVLSRTNLTIANSSANVVYSLSGLTFSDNTSIGTSYSLGNRNRIINGNMAIDQRNSGSSVTLSSVIAYCSDRWVLLAVTNYGMTAQRVSTSNNDFPYALRIQRTSGTASVTTTYGGQVLESVNCSDLSGQKVTLSFYATAGANYSASSSALNYKIITGTGTDEGAGKMYAGTWASSAETANGSVTISTTRTRFSVTTTIPAGTNEIGVVFYWTSSGTAGLNDYVDITGVQFEQGSVVTPFEFNPYAYQLSLCQRYYFKCGGESSAYPYIDGSAWTATARYGLLLPFPVTMRKTPTVTKYGTWTVTNCGQPTVGNATKDGFTIVISGTAAGNMSAYPSGSTTYIDADAEIS